MHVEQEEPWENTFNFLIVLQQPLLLFIDWCTSDVREEGEGWTEGRREGRRERDGGREGGGEKGSGGKKGEREMNC